MTRPTPFVVYTSPRTGSAWLISLLDSHPQVVAYPELFLAGASGPLPYAASDMPYFSEFLQQRPAPLWPLRPLHLALYLARLYRPRPGVSAVGFKLMYRQAAANPGLVPLLALRRVRVLHLTRANLLAALVSYRVARSRQAFHPRLGEVLPPLKVRLDPHQLVAELASREAAVEAARRRLRRLRLRYLEVGYERLSEQPRLQLARILSFLGADPAQAEHLRSPFLRIHSGSPAELIENVAEVRRALAATRFAWMLEQAAAGALSSR